MRAHNSTDIPAKIRHVFALSCCKEMCRILNGIDFLFYKGPVHAEELYTDPWVRQSGDIDIIVKPKDVDAVLRRLGDSGYMYLDGGSIGTQDFCTNYQTGHPDMTIWHSHAGELVDKTGKQMSVEVHVSPFKISNQIPISLHVQTADALFDRRRFVDIRGETYPMLGRTDELVALIHHFAKHAAQQMTVFNCSFYRGGRLPLQYLAEIAIYIDRYSDAIGTGLAEKLIASYGMTAEFRLTERLLQKLHGLSFPFAIPESSVSDEWEQLFTEILRLETEELLSPDVYPRMKKILSARAPYSAYCAARDGEDPEWVLVDENYKFAGSVPKAELPLYSFSWCASRECERLRVLARIPLWQIDECGSLALRVQLGGDDCCGCRDCLKNYSLMLSQKGDKLQGQLERIIKKVAAKNEMTPTKDSVDVEIRKDGDFAKISLLFRNEHRKRLPFNIGMSISRSRTGEECDSDTVLMWTKGTSFPFSCLLLGEIR